MIHEMILRLVPVQAGVSAPRECVFAYVDRREMTASCTRNDLHYIHAPCGYGCVHSNAHVWVRESEACDDV